MNRLLVQTQYSFQKGHSMTRALQHPVQNVKYASNSGIAAMPIFIDIRKALDTVDYQALLHRMRTVGMNGVCL